jgi:CMP-N,N'-diacetyllegionaminic acid synthase
MKFGALIPCRTGSKGIPKKNFKFLCDRPLWEWSYSAAIKSHVFDTIIVSSDGGLPTHGFVGITKFDNECYAPFHTDMAQLDPLMVHYAEIFPQIEVWVLLQPTSPLRTEEDIRVAASMIDDCDGVISVERVSDKYWRPDGTPLYDPNNRSNRQESPGLFYENGSIYVIRADVLLELQCRIADIWDIGFYEMPHERSIQIDSPLDWAMVEFIMSHKLVSLAA